MKNVLNYASYLPRLTALLVAVVLSVATTTFAAAATNTAIEGDITVKNVSDNATTYEESTTASNEEVVRFKVWYHNKELATSGKIAENLSIKVDFPTDAASQHEVAVTIKGDNTNTVTDSAIVNIDGNTNARLEYIPGTAKWQHNVGTREDIQYNFTDLDDGIVTDGAFVRIEDQQPCFEYEAWVYFDAKVVVEEEEPEPIFECTALTALPAAVKPDEDVTFKATANADNGADITKYVFEFGDGENATINTSSESAETKHSYDETGTYTSQVTVHFDVDGDEKTDTNADCTAKVSVEKEPEQPPVTPPTPELPSTGPASVAAGFFGTSALFMGARSWLESRRILRAGLLKK